MLRLALTPDQRAAVEKLRRDPALRPAERDRVEMLLLAAGGWSVDQIAAHFGCCRQTVRRLLHRYASMSLAAVHRQHPGPPTDLARRAQVTTALDALLAQDRTWTAGQLAAALAPQDIHVGARQVRRYLHAMGAGYRRTVRTLHHRQDPARVAQAKAELAAFKKGRKRAS
jgi:transposase